MNRADAVETIISQFIQFKRRVHQQAAQLHASQPVTPAQMEVLFVLSRGHTQVSEITSHLHVTPSALTQQLKPLELLGLIQRVQDEHDKRSVQVHLTDDGTAFLAAHRKAAVAYFTRQLDRLDDEELAKLAELFAKVTQL